VPSSVVNEKLPQLIRATIGSKVDDGVGGLVSDAVGALDVVGESVISAISLVGAPDGAAVGSKGEGDGDGDGDGEKKRSKGGSVDPVLEDPFGAFGAPAFEDPFGAFGSLIDFGFFVEKPLGSFVENPLTDFGSFVEKPLGSFGDLIDFGSFVEKPLTDFGSFVEKPFGSLIDFGFFVESPDNRRR